MTIDDAAARRAALENSMTEAVRSFERDTGLRLSLIQLSPSAGTFAAFVTVRAELAERDDE